MGGIADFFGGSRKSQDFDAITIDRLGPPGTGPGSKAFFQGVLRLINEGVATGSTPEQDTIFAQDRSNTIRGFEDFLQRSNINFGRAGLGSSGFRNRNSGALAIGLADTLARQDAQRAAQALDRRLNFATQGTAALSGLTQGTVLNPVVRDEGFGSRLLKTGLSTGLGALATFGIGSAFGAFGGGAGAAGGAAASAPTNIKPALGF